MEIPIETGRGWAERSAAAINGSGLLPAGWTAIGGGDAGELFVVPAATIGVRGDLPDGSPAVNLFDRFAYPVRAYAGEYVDVPRSAPVPVGDRTDPADYSGARESRTDAGRYARVAAGLIAGYFPNG